MAYGFQGMAMVTGLRQRGGCELWEQHTAQKRPCDKVGTFGKW
ncbi:hypothetical protein HMPREF3202_01365 [Prevotella bivia]|uniref:Uncharacterized protein n=1 Tax=Prevotella bivia TaxID=28125 RepID=A0A137SVU1_9BACT|nr:hypothetical protein HMPREF3202_01365 [Prevotella bivia]